MISTHDILMLLVAAVLLTTNFSGAYFAFSQRFRNKEDDMMRLLEAKATGPRARLTDTLAQIYRSVAREPLKFHFLKAMFGLALIANALFTLPHLWQSKGFANLSDTEKLAFSVAAVVVLGQLFDFIMGLLSAEHIRRMMEDLLTRPEDEKL